MNAITGLVTARRKLGLTINHSLVTVRKRAWGLNHSLVTARRTRSLTQNHSLATGRPAARG